MKSIITQNVSCTKVVQYLSLEKRRELFYTCCGVQSTVMLNLQRVRKIILNHFPSSTCWTAWCWIKSEWLLTKKNGRIDFLCRCRSLKIIPRFITDRIKTRDLFQAGDHRVAACERNLGLQVLSMVIRKEFKERAELT